MFPWNVKNKYKKQKQKQKQKKKKKKKKLTCKYGLTFLVIVIF